jgi:hypothetical protein
MYDKANVSSMQPVCILIQVVCLILLVPDTLGIDCRVVVLF